MEILSYRPAYVTGTGRTHHKYLRYHTAEVLEPGIPFHQTAAGYTNNCVIRKGFPCGSSGNLISCNAGDLDSIPGSGRCSGEGQGYPLQSSGLENSMDCMLQEKTVPLGPFFLNK